jgi:glycosyltransferase involved in cell wall biosynthesis
LSAADARDPHMTTLPSIDVIIVVDDASAGFASCIESLEAAGGFDRLIIVDDSAGDSNVGAILRARPRRHLLLRTGRRLGMAAAVNRAIGFSTHDIVVVDSGAVVSAGWLDRLARCMASDPSIGTASPFTNDAESGSFLHARESSQKPEERALVDRAISSAGGPFYPDITSGSRVCLLVRRGLVRAIGAFDETLPGARDAVLDFCRRASTAGWRNVLCDDTFVGSLAAVLQTSHTTHDSSAVVASDPLRALRGIIRSRFAVLANPGKTSVLHVLHDRGGGTAKFVNELIATTRGDYRHYFLRVLPDRWRLTDPLGNLPVYDYRWRIVDDGDDVIHYDLPRGLSDDAASGLASLCAFLDIGIVHVHSLVGSGDELPALLAAASLPYCYTAHDMYLPCPTVYLIDADGAYCNATTDPVACSRCLAKFDAWKDIDIVQWRDRSAGFIRGARHVFAPSQWAADTLAKYFPGVDVTIAPPWPEARERAFAGAVTNGFDLPNDACRHIGVLGAIGPEKGARHVEALARRIRERNLPLRIVVVGYLDCEHRGQSQDKVLTIHGPYEAAEVGALLDHYRIGVALFPTVWPETFCYTLSEAWEAGRPVLVPPTGALQERVLATGAGWMMSGWPDPDRMLDQLMSVTSPEQRSERERRARLASAARSKETGGRQRIVDAYRALVAVSASQGETTFDAAVVVDAACRAAGVAPFRRGTSLRAPEQNARSTAPRRRIAALLRW